MCVYVIIRVRLIEEVENEMTLTCFHIIDSMLFNYTTMIERIQVFSGVLILVGLILFSFFLEVIFVRREFDSMAPFLYRLIVNSYWFLLKILNSYRKLKIEN